MKQIITKTLIALFTAILVLPASAQDAKKVIEDKIDIKVSPVKNQYRSGTCWSFASVSFLEAEIMRVGNPVYDLSEMFVVRNCYAAKADRYVRMHGKTNFGPGGLAQDLVCVWKNIGLVPDEAYTGMTIGETGPVHGEMDAVLEGYVKAVVENPNRKLTPVWKEGFDGILDAYLGEYPEKFSYKGVEYTPKSFAASLSVDPDDYVFIGSFTHHPFYKPFILEIPDNWGWNNIDNVPLDELMKLLDNALEKGYTVCWDADVSEKGFNWSDGIASFPVKGNESLANLEQARWSELTDDERKALMEKSGPDGEIDVTPAIRQEMFDNYQTTDDHLMHITGIGYDQDGKKYYKVKNSWGVGNHIYEGFFYSTEAFMKAKTLFFMVHKDAVPKDIAKKLSY